MALDPTIAAAINKLANLDAAAQYLNSNPNGTVLSDDMQGQYLAASKWRTSLDPSIVSQLNTIYNATPTVTLAWGYLRSIGTMTVAEQGLYIASSEFGASASSGSTTGNGGTTGGQNSGTSLTSLFGLLTPVSAVGGMIGNSGPTAAATSLAQAQQSYAVAQNNFDSYSLYIKTHNIDLNAPDPNLSTPMDPGSADYCDDLSGEVTYQYEVSYQSQLNNLATQAQNAKTNFINQQGEAGIANQNAQTQGIQGLMPKIGTGVMAAIMQYEVFSAAEKAAAKAVTMTIAMLGATWLGAIGATMLFLSKLDHYTPGTDGGATPIANGLYQVLHQTCGKGIFTITPDVAHMPQFLFTLAVATAITSLVLAAGIIAGLPGSQGETTPTGAAVSSALANVPHWYSTIPSAAVAMISIGFTVGTSAFTLSPDSLFTQFPVDSIQLSTALTTAGSPGASILVQQSQTPGGYDTVFVVTPGADGTSTISAFQVDTNGYLVGPNGPDKSFRPIATPTVDGSGKSTGYTLNPGSLEAIYQIPACMAIANDRSMKANIRESALETCLRNNKTVQFIPIGGS